MTVLAVEDDLKISRLIRESLEQAGYEVETAADGREALDLASSRAFDVMILDLMLPEISGLDVITKLREKRIDTPCLILSAKVSVADRVEGLRAGGDDYLVKPFAVDELLARIEALVRRSSRATPEDELLTYEDLLLDERKREVSRAGTRIDLQAKEFALLNLLMRHRERVVTKMQILKQVWNYDFDPQTNVVDVLVWRLRSKIDRDFSPKLIQTARGVGYVLRLP